jgi:hypothetical protein
VDLIDAVKVGLPREDSEWVKKYRPNFLPKTLGISFDRCMIMKYAGDISLKNYVKKLNVAEWDRIIYELARQILKDNPLLIVII